MSAADFEDPQDSDRDNDYDFVVTATDLEGNASDLAVTLSVVDDTTAPVMAASATVDFEGNQALETIVFTASAEDDSDLVAFTLAGDDADKFDFDTDTGALTFTSAHGVPNFDTPGDLNGDGDYDLEITATDPEGNAALQVLTITLIDVA